MQAATEQFNRVDRRPPPAPAAGTARCIAVNHKDLATQRAAAGQQRPTGIGISNARQGGSTSPSLRLDR
jgi:hypothetical protein